MTTKTHDVDFEITGDVLDRINDALDRKKKIEAIKYFREATGAGLKDAKDAVELMMRHRSGH
jgi:ribosomal protein L7/L12